MNLMAIHMASLSQVICHSQQETLPVSLVYIIFKRIRTIVFIEYRFINVKFTVTDYWS